VFIRGQRKFNRRAPDRTIRRGGDFVESSVTGRRSGCAGETCVRRVLVGAGKYSSHQFFAIRRTGNGRPIPTGRGCVRGFVDIPRWGKEN
jgi:hypothetical protein